MLNSEPVVQSMEVGGGLVLLAQLEVALEAAAAEDHAAAGTDHVAPAVAQHA